MTRPERVGQVIREAHHRCGGRLLGAVPETIVAVPLLVAAAAALSGYLWVRFAVLAVPGAVSLVLRTQLRRRGPRERTDLVQSLVHGDPTPASHVHRHPGQQGGLRRAPDRLPRQGRRMEGMGDPAEALTLPPPVRTFSKQGLAIPARCRMMNGRPGVECRRSEGAGAARRPISRFFRTSSGVDAAFIR